MCSFSYGVITFLVIIVNFVSCNANTSCEPNFRRNQDEKIELIVSCLSNKRTKYCRIDEIRKDTTYLFCELAKGYNTSDINHAIVNSTCPNDRKSTLEAKFIGIADMVRCNWTIGDVNLTGSHFVYFFPKIYNNNICHVGIFVYF